MKLPSLKKSFVYAAFAAVCALPAEVRIQNSAPADHTVAVGSPVTFTISGLSEFKTPPPARLLVNMAQGTDLALPVGQDVFVYTVTPSVPGTLVLAVNPGKGRFTGDYRDCARSGVAVSPEKVTSALTPAPDLAAYWKSLIDSLKGVSAAPHLKLIETKDGIELYEFEIDAGGGAFATAAGAKAIGYMAKPVGKGPFPALVNFHGAGTFFGRPETALKYAPLGVMCWSLNPHAIPNSLTDKERSAIRHGALKTYNQIGKDGPREGVYFNGMFKRDYQVIQAVTQSPYWDKKHLVVHGFSQGGAQTIATAYMCPEVVTAIAPGAPAITDVLGDLEGRAPGWPYWAKDNKNPQPACENARTFDMLNLAPLMRTPMLLGAGFYDATCPASAQMAFYNRYAGPKQFVFMPDAAHNTDPNWDAVELAFLKKNLGLK